MEVACNKSKPNASEFIYTYNVMAVNQNAFSGCTKCKNGEVEMFKCDDEKKAVFGADSNISTSTFKFLSYLENNFNCTGVCQSQSTLKCTYFGNTSR